MNKMTTIECLAQLKEIVMKVPDLRFMQLIVNFQQAHGGDCYYMENEDFLKEITDMINSYFKTV
jgi:hypothetical protein